jgi:hypothetical protein
MKQAASTLRLSPVNGDDTAAAQNYCQMLFEGPDAYPQALVFPLIGGNLLSQLGEQSPIHDRRAARTAVGATEVYAKQRSAPADERNHQDKYAPSHQIPPSAMPAQTGNT